eukprot:1522810-Amphidinium_carterae.1
MEIKSTHKQMLKTIVEGKKKKRYFHDCSVITTTFYLNEEDAKTMTTEICQQFDTKTGEAQPPWQHRFLMFPAQHHSTKETCHAGHKITAIAHQPSAQLLRREWTQGYNDSNNLDHLQYVNLEHKKLQTLRSTMTLQRKTTNATTTRLDRRQEHQHQEATYSTCGQAIIEEENKCRRRNTTEEARRHYYELLQRKDLELPRSTREDEENTEDSRRLFYCSDTKGAN